MEAGSDEEELYDKDDFDNEDNNEEMDDYDDNEKRESPLVAPISFHQDLINQLNTFILNDSRREIAKFLKGSIDDMGYIR